MPKQYLLYILIKDLSEAVELEVRESEWLRIQQVLNQSDDFDDESRFLTFDSIEGLSVGINIAEIQLIRFLWNPVGYASDLKRIEEPITIWIKGRSDPLLTDISDSETLTAFFVCLEAGAKAVQFPCFEDEDGEIVQVNAREVSMVTAPLHLTSDGRRDDINEDDDSIYF